MNAVFTSPLAPTVAQRRCTDYQALNKIDVNASSVKVVFIPADPERGVVEY